MADETMNVKETTKPKVSSSKKLTDVLPVRPTSDAKKQTAIGTGIVVGLLSGLVGAPLLAMGAIGVGAGAGGSTTGDGSRRPLSERRMPVGINDDPDFSRSSQSGSAALYVKSSSGRSSDRRPILLLAVHYYMLPLADISY